MLHKYFPEPDIKTYIATQQSTYHALILAVTSLLLSLGFVFGSQTDSHNYRALYDIMPATAWAFCFFVYSGTKWLQVFRLAPTWIEILCSLFLGIWLWSCIFISFIVLDIHDIAPIEFLLVTPLLIESYQLALDLYRYRMSRQQKGSYG